MTDDEFNQRLDDLHSALGNIVQTYTPDGTSIVEAEGVVTYAWDPTQGLSIAELRNFTFSALGNLATLTDQTRSWFRHKGIQAVDMEAFVRNNPCVAIVNDLFNAWKHAGHAQKTWSRRQPILQGLQRVVRITSPSGPNQVAGMMMDSSGRMVPFGGGTSAYRVTARVVDKVTGDELGDLSNMLEDALQAWESMLANSART